jgi:hypothetical protein
MLSSGQFPSLWIRHLSAYKDGTECSETSAYKIQTPGNYPEESIQHSQTCNTWKCISSSLPIHFIHIVWKKNPPVKKNHCYKPWPEGNVHLHFVPRVTWVCHTKSVYTKSTHGIWAKHFVIGWLLLFTCSLKISSKPLRKYALSLTSPCLS